jgi:hypothetical protein
MFLDCPISVFGGRQSRATWFSVAGVAVMMKTKDNDFQGGEQNFLGWIDKAGRSANLTGTRQISSRLN